MRKNKEVFSTELDDGCETAMTSMVVVMVMMVVMVVVCW